VAPKQRAGSRIVDMMLAFDGEEAVGSEMYRRDIRLGAGTGRGPVVPELETNSTSTSAMSAGGVACSCSLTPSRK